MKLEIYGQSYTVEKQEEGYKVTFPSGYTTTLKISNTEKQDPMFALNSRLAIAAAVGGLTMITLNPQA